MIMNLGMGHYGGPPRGFGEQWNKGIYFRGTWDQRPNFEGNRETKTILGNREHRKQIFDFGGTGEQANLFQGNKGTGTPPPWEGLMCSKFYKVYINDGSELTWTHFKTMTNVAKLVFVLIVGPDIR